MLCFEGVLLSGQSEVISVEFKDEDEAEKAIQQVLVSLNGKTKAFGKITLNIVFVFVFLFALLALVNSTLAFFAPVPAVPQVAQLQLPPFAAQGGVANAGGGQGNAHWGLPLSQQEAMAKRNEAAAGGQAATTQSLNAQYQEDLAKKMQQAQELMNGNLQNMRDNRDVMVDGGNPYQTEPQQAQQSSGSALINALQGK